MLGCGEYGHPRRERKVYLERMGKGQRQDVAAQKGAGKQGKGGKWGKGKGKGTQGKGYYGGKGYQGYRSPGKAVGKGLNYWGEDDYIAAWGNELENEYNCGEWDYHYGDMNYVGNHMVLLEQNTNTSDNTQHMSSTKTAIRNTVTGRHDPLTLRLQPKPIITSNKDMSLADDNDSDDNDSDEIDPEHVGVVEQQRRRHTHNTLLSLDVVHVGVDMVRTIETRFLFIQHVGC